jgi:hypothetical protein
MRIFISRRSAARFVFILGIFLMLFGIAFLLGTLSGISGVSVFISFSFIAAGIACASLALILNKRTIYLFIAALFFQTGIFLFLSALHIIPMEFSKAWPVLSIFSGFALIPAGWRHFGKIHYKFIVPAAAFLALGIALFVFSLKLVSFSLAQFVIAWWPLLIILAGLTLILLVLASKNSGENKQ